jgi:hypothetical protein
MTPIPAGAPDDWRDEVIVSEHVLGFCEKVASLVGWRGFAELPPRQ